MFYDGFESGNTNLWQKDDFRNTCQVVSASDDGVAGPFSGMKMLRCNDNGTVAWNDPASFETLVLNNVNYDKELFIRVRVRIDKNLQPTPGSSKKFLRVFHWTGDMSTYNDIFETAYPEKGFVTQVLAGGQQGSTYWGNFNGDNTMATNAWHKVEYYINTSGVIKVWHDGVLVQNVSGFPTNKAKFFPFYITSNWAEPHSATNVIYFDEFEVFSDSGTGASGSMSSASIQK